MPNHTSGEVILIFGLSEIFILNLCMFSFVINEARSVESLGMLAGSLGLFRTREHA
jgi:hypothetical protein